MTSSTEQAPIALLRSERSERRLGRLLHPRLASVLVPGVVALTAALLYTWWPVGVLVGCVASAIAVLAVGVVMQRAERAAPVAEDLVVQLGIRAAAAPSDPAAPAPAPVEAVAAVAETPRAAAPDWFEPASRGPVVAVAEAQVLAVTAKPVLSAARAAEEAAAMADIERAAMAQHAAEEAAVRDAMASVTTDDDADVQRLRCELGDDYEDFARAARHVVATQYASAARLQRDLGVPYSRARRLIDGLEAEHFVGPATGSLPRQVMVPKDRLPELERILEGS